MLPGASRISVAVAALAAALVAAPAAHAGSLRAGTAVVDATWHVGASAGQYASTRPESTDADPHVHQTKNAPSYGVQSRLEMRALVVQGAPNGMAPGGRDRFALVKTDLYIPQDLLYRRAAQLIREKGIDWIDRGNLVMATTHDHSSPYYTSTAWGAWTFQDVIDIRAYEYYADRIAEAVVQAARNMKPVRVGGGATHLDAVHRNSQGPDHADDGTPAGYPYRYTDHDLSVVRLDDISRPDRPDPLAVLVNYSNHPEGLDGNDLISADWVSAMERMVDRATGATTIYTQNAVGHAEMERSTHRQPGERHEYYHREYAQGERAGRLTADAALSVWRGIGRNAPDPNYGDRFVPFFEDGPVDFRDHWFPGPLTHPYPAVSSCRTEALAQNPPDPRVPIVGLPDCQGPSTIWSEIGFSPPAFPVNGPGVTLATLQSAGVPVPQNYGAPSFTGLEEDVSVHLQGFRIGDIFFPVCSCEQWADQSYNTKARTDRVAGNETHGDNLGFDWSERCEPQGNQYSCPDPRNEATRRLTVSAAAFARMRAQINNDAHGWNATTYAPYAESEPADPAQIKGNFTHDDNQTSAALGYRLTIPISMANDYNGYIVSYREFQQGDHYRKALAGWGPHSSDYMGTRLVKIGRLMNGGPPLTHSVRDPQGRDAGRGGAVDPDADNVTLTTKTDFDVAQNDARAAALGANARAAISAYEAQLPDDRRPAITRQPPNVERFDLASVTWDGGSNYTDNPIVVVERREGRRWVEAANGQGEVITTLRLPGYDQVAAYREPGSRYSWTAHFEAFVSQFDPGGGDVATPPGTYRFAISGARRAGGRVEPYRLTSQEFSVREWSGINVFSVKRERNSRVSFLIGPRHRHEAKVDLDERPLARPVPFELGPIDYPDSYASRRAGEKARFIRDLRQYARDPAAPTGLQPYCLHCSFRPWLDVGDAQRVTVTFAGPRRTTRAAARLRDGRWYTRRKLRARESAYVCPGDARDPWRNYNGGLSPVVGSRDVRIDCRPIGYRCVSRRDFTIRLPAPRRGLRIRSGTIVYRGRRVRAVRRGGRFRARVNLRGLRKDRFTVRIRVRTSDGRRYTSLRRYRTCTPKRRPGRPGA